MSVSGPSFRPFPNASFILENAAAATFPLLLLPVPAFT